MDFLSDDDILNRDSSDDELSLTPARRGIVRPLPPSAERMNRQQLNRFQGMSWYDNHDGTIEIRSNTGGVVTIWTRRRYQANWRTECGGDITTYMRAVNHTRRLASPMTTINNNNNIDNTRRLASPITTTTTNNNSNNTFALEEYGFKLVCSTMHVVRRGMPL